MFIIETVGIFVTGFEVREEERVLEKKKGAKKKRTPPSRGGPIRLMIASGLVRLLLIHRYDPSRAIQTDPTRLTDRVEEILDYTAPNPGLLAH